MILETTSGNISVAARPRDPWGAYRVSPTDSLSGQGVTPESSLALTAVYGAVSLVADANGIMPLEVIDTRGKTGQRVVAGGWMPGMLQHEPNDDMSGVDLWTFVNACLLLRGNAYLAKLAVGGGRVQLYPMLPDYVTPYRNDAGSKVFRVRMYDGSGYVDHDYTPDAILHIKGRSFTDPLVGSSPIQAMRHMIGTQLALQEYRARAYADGMLIKGVLSTPSANITPDAADRIKAQWKQATGGVGASHDVAVLHSGVTFQPVALSPEDAQLIQTMKWGHTEIATAYKIPASRLNGEGTSLTYANQGQDDLYLDKQACLPIRSMIEAALNRDTTLFGAYSAWVPRFNPEIVLRADAAARTARYVQLRSIGAISVNEIRRFEDWADIGPAGDDYTAVGGGSSAAAGVAVSERDRSERMGILDEVVESRALKLEDERMDRKQRVDAMSEVVDALRRVSSPEIPAPEVRVDVHVPEQPAPQIHVEPSEVRVDVAASDAPQIVVNVPEQPAPVVHFNPRVEVLPAPPRGIKFERDGRGFITGAETTDG